MKNLLFNACKADFVLHWLAKTKEDLSSPIIIIGLLLLLTNAVDYLSDLITFKIRCKSDDHGYHVT